MTNDDDGHDDDQWTFPLFFLSFFLFLSSSAQAGRQTLDGIVAYSDRRGLAGGVCAHACHPSVRVRRWSLSGRSVPRLRSVLSWLLPHPSHRQGLERHAVNSCGGAVGYNGYCMAWGMGHGAWAWPFGSVGRYPFFFISGNFCFFPFLFFLLFRFRLLRRAYTPPVSRSG